MARGGEGNCSAGGSHSRVMAADETLIGNQPLDGGRGQVLRQRTEMEIRVICKVLTIDTSPPFLNCSFRNGPFFPAPL